MFTMFEGQSCEVVVNGHAVVIEITKLVSNGALYNFGGVEHVIVGTGRSSQLWHWWHIADSDPLFHGVNYKVGVSLLNWPVNSEEHPRCIGITADGCDSITLL